MLLLAIVLSVLVGVSLGLLGGGGSILTVPILRYVLGLEAHAAIALSLLVVGTTSLAALIPHARRGRVRWKIGALFGVAGMIGAYSAGSVASLIPSEVLLGLFAAMMLATAFAMLRKTGARATKEVNGELPLFKVFGEGLAVGAVTGLVGAGGGFLVVPALVLLGGLSMDVAIGTSLVVIAMKSFAGFAGFVGHTPIDWRLGAAVSLAAVIGSIAGGLVAPRVSPAGLRALFGWFVVAMAFFILAQELPVLLGATPSLPLAAAAAVVGTVLAAGLQRVSRCFKRGTQSAETPGDLIGTKRVTPELGGKAT